MELRRKMEVALSIGFAFLMSTGQRACAVDACSLLTADQAATALGVPAVNTGAGANRCVWTPKKYARGAGQLTVLVEGANDGAKMMGQGTAVNGVSDEAIQTVVGNGAVLHVRKGNTWFVVNLHGVPLEQATQVEQTVAKEMVGKL
jgi:hypothetical protein